MVQCPVYGIFGNGKALPKNPKQHRIVPSAIRSLTTHGKHNDQRNKGFAKN